MERISSDESVNPGVAALRRCAGAPAEGDRLRRFEVGQRAQ